MLRDLGSTNGTFVSGDRVDPAREQVLIEGAEIAFGHPTESAYRFVSAAEPVAIARAAGSGRVVAADHNLLVLPNEDAPEVTVFQTAAGQWQLEDAQGEVRAVRSKDSFEVDGQTWTLELPAASDRTPIADSVMSLATIELRLRISRDQDEVDVALVTGAKAVSLGARWYGYFLAVLARARLEAKEVEAGERGWCKMKDLTRMLKLDSNALNVATHRARRELAAAGLSDAAGVIEIRRGYRRLGTSRVRVEQLD